MRSDLIFGALTHVNNRYELCQLASKATRKLHKPNTRLQDTTNEVLDRFKDTIPMDESERLSRRYNYKNAAQLNARQFHPFDFQPLVFSCKSNPSAVEIQLPFWPSARPPSSSRSRLSFKHIPPKNPKIPGRP